MSLREVAEKHKVLMSGIGIALACLAIFFAIHQSGSSDAVTRLSKDFYSNDDGKTYFVDDADKVVPFDYGGSQACRAHVYRCSGKVFVGYLERYTDTARQRLLALKQQQASGVDVSQQMADAGANASEVKKPGDSKWYPVNSPQGAAAVTVKCPDGGTLEGVVP